MRKRPETREFPPVTAFVTRKVRFEEVDQIGYMWHGRYASWFEDGREAIGEKYNLSYLTFHAHKTIIPLKHFSLEYKMPLLYNHEYRIETDLLWNESAILEYDYRILNNENQIMTTGKTIQMMLDLEGGLLLESPKFYRIFCDKWRNF